MAKPIQMPALSPTMTEGKITKWRKKVGDKVSSGDAVAEVETDKSNLEIEAYDDGFLISINVEEGASAPVGAPIAFIGEKGEKAGAPEQQPKADAKPEQKRDQQPAEKPADKPATQPAAESKAQAIPVQMPALSPTMTEGKITKWLKKEGDQVTSGEGIAEVETDKSNLQIENYDDGVLLKIVVQEGEMAPVGAPIGFVGPKGARIPDAKSNATRTPEEPSAEVRSGTAPDAQREAKEQKGEAKPQATPPKSVTTSPAAAKQGPGRRIFASPLAKRIAKDRGVDLGALFGSGPSGRIVKKDVEQAASVPPAQKGSPAHKPGTAMAPRAGGARPEPKRVELTTMRKVIGQRMAEAKPGVPHFYLTLDVEMDEALKIRDEAKLADAKISVNDLLVKAMAIALRRFPKMNVAMQGDHMVQFETVDIGVAVALEDGLITPILRDVDQKGLVQISAETRELAERARSRKLRPEEYSGGSITISNLGMYGIDHFSAVINPPQAAILAVGQAAEKVVVRDGAMVVRRVMTATLSVDHRAIDGATGAQYLKELKGLLEHPLRWLF